MAYLIAVFSLPIGILLWNTSELLAKTFEPFIRLFILLFEPCIDCFRSHRRSSSAPIHDPQVDKYADGDHHTETKKSTLYV